MNLGLSDFGAGRYGRELREERRAHAIERDRLKATLGGRIASGLAKEQAGYSMAEVERRQLGQTGRTKMRQTGETARARMRQRGETHRTGMKIGSERELMGMKLAGAGERGGGGFTTHQMANFRNKAYNQAQSKWNKIWEMEEAIDPFTNQPMDEAQKRELIGLEAQNIMDYSFEGIGGGEEPIGSSGVSGGYGSSFGGGYEGETARSTLASPEQMEEYRLDSIREFEENYGAQKAKRRARSQSMLEQESTQAPVRTPARAPMPAQVQTSPQQRYPTRRQQWQRTPQQGFAQMKRSVSGLGRGVGEQGRWPYTGGMGRVGSYLMGSQRESRRRLSDY